jgi:hypothetical protein
MSVEIGDEQEAPPEEGEFGEGVVVEDDYRQPPGQPYLRPTQQQLAQQQQAQQMIRRRMGENFAETEVELDSRFITPEAKMKFNEITRDVRTSNYSEDDVELACLVGEILRMIDIMENRYFGEGSLERLRQYYDSELQYIANTRAAFKGFIPQLAKTQRMESVPTPMLGGAYGEEVDTSGIGGIWGKIRGKGRKSPSAMI